MRKVLVLSNEELDFIRRGVDNLEDESFDAGDGLYKSVIKKMRDPLEIPDGDNDIPTETTQDIPEDAYIALSIVPALSLDIRDKNEHFKRLQTIIAFHEAEAKILEPLKDIGGGNLVKDVLLNFNKRRDLKANFGTAIGWKITGILDSVALKDYIDGKRSDLATLICKEKE